MDTLYFKVPSGLYTVIIFFLTRKAETYPIKVNYAHEIGVICSPYTNFIYHTKRSRHRTNFKFEVFVQTG